MSTSIQLPALSPTMKEGKITKWLKKEGDKVSSGEAIAECETDKSNLEIEAYDDGYLLQILVKEGESTPVGSPIAIIGAKGEKVSAAAAAPAEAAPASTPPPGQPAAAAPAAQPEPAAPAASTPAPPAQAKPAPAAPAAPRAEEPADARLRASPLAKKMAQSEGVDLGSLQGSGPQGRIVKRDIEVAMTSGVQETKAKKGPKPAPSFGFRAEPTSTPISSMRKVISQRMAEVKPGVPHFYLSVDVEMDEAMKLREQAKAADTRISVNDIIVKAAGVALKRFPKANVSLQGDRVLQFSSADVGIAVAIEDGLITPVIRDADFKTLGAIGEETRDLAERARKRALKPEEYTGGSLTVSNLGMYGMDAFIAVINPPQAIILAVGSVSEKAVVRDGQLAIRKIMTVTLSGDHRVIDGATGAQYLQELKALLERPVRLLF